MALSVGVWHHEDHPSLSDHYMATACRHCGDTRYWTVTQYGTASASDIEFCTSMCAEAFACSKQAELNDILSRLDGYSDGFSA